MKLVRTSLLILICGVSCSLVPSFMHASWSVAPKDRVMLGFYDMWQGVASGVAKISRGIVDATDAALIKIARDTGLSTSWSNHQQATLLCGIAAATGLGYILYRVGKARGKKEMARSIARSVQVEQGEHSFL